MRDINSIIIELLRQRGITDEDDIREFLSSKPQKMHDPFLLHNMKAGVDLIVSALENNKRICIYGDYDADGITATTIMMDGLSTVTGNITYYIPSRFEEGYGLNKEAIDAIYHDGCELIITVDCGSVSYEEVDYAKSLGLEIIVTDHHSLDKKKADCILINPKQEEDQYPFENLAGCGVAFKVMHALVKEGIIDREVLTRSLDLVAIGTIGDVVPLVDENRTFAKYGIRSLNMGLRPGLKTLIKEILPKNQVLTSDNISFGIVPHLNASGRMEDASIAVELLRSNRNNGDEDVVIEDVARRLIENNELRKKTQNKAYEECKQMVEEKHKEDSFIILRADDIHEGIAGIVAGKVKEFYNRPTIIVTKSGDSLKGTGRSVDSVNLYELLNKYSHLFQRFGGHAGACGFTIEEEFIEELREKLMSEMENQSSGFEESQEWDLDLSISDVDMDLAMGVGELAPFGNKNPKPVFRIEHVKIDNMKYLGENQQHVRFDAIRDDRSVPCILFNRAKDYVSKLEEDSVSIIGSLEVQYWRNTSRLQFIIEEIQ